LTLALPHDVHRQSVDIAAAAGKHALVEKPIATTLEDADAMIRAAREANTILMVAEDMHFRPAVHEAARRIERGDLGEPLYALIHAGGIRRPSGWAAEKDRMGGGVLIDIGVHYIRGLRLLLGEPDSVIATRAMQINTKMTSEDSVQLLFSSKAGWQAHMLLSWSSQRGHLPDIVVAGEKDVERRARRQPGSIGGNVVDLSVGLLVADGPLPVAPRRRSGSAVGRDPPSSPWSRADRCRAQRGSPAAHRCSGGRVPFLPAC